MKLGVKRFKQDLALLAASLEATADGLLVVNQQGEILIYNERFSRMWRIPASVLDSGDDQEALRYVISQLDNPDTFLSQVQDLYAQPERTSFDLLEFRDGRIFERYSFPLTLAGKIEGRVWSFRDITEQRKIDSSLKESEERYRVIFESSTLGILNMRRDGTFIRANSAFSRFIGYTESELLKMNILDVTHPNDRERTVSGFRDSASNDRVEFEKRYIRKDGEIIWGRISSSWVRSAYGEYSVAIIQDITERKRVELEKEQSLSLLHATLESTADGIMVLDLDIRIVSWNQKFVQLWKIPEAIMATRNGREVLAYVKDQLKEPESFLSIVGQLQAQPEVERLDLLELKDGRLFERYTLPQRIEGKCVGRVISIRDISERKRMEEERSKHEKLDSLGLLAGGIAHDFNNILTAILGNISLARAKAGLDSDLARILFEAEKASLRGKGLSNQLLTFAKGGSPNKTVNSVSELLVESTEFVLRGSNVRARFEIPEGLWPVEVDEGQIIQVFQNLVINAQQAMPAGGLIDIRVGNIQISDDDEKEPFVKNGPYIRIQIGDNGPGIEPDILPKIFDPYFTTKQKGSGLGLSISYSVVKRHGGYLTVRSEIGRGTVFTILIPAFSEKLLPEARKESSLIMGTGRVLLMDDEAFVRQIGGDILGFLGYDAELASSGEEAISRYRNGMETGKPFDLVILDLTVPGAMNGKETMQKLVEMDPKVRGLVSSGYSDSALLSDFHLFGFAGIIPKPYRIEEFSQILANALKKKKS